MMVRSIKTLKPQRTDCLNIDVIAQVVIKATPLQIASALGRLQLMLPNYS